jgi:lipopolysaccharide transport system ATP-binding protein
MKEPILEIENVSKVYRLGQIGTGTLSHDLKRIWYRWRGLPDPYLKIAEENERTTQGGNQIVAALKDINLQIYPGEVVGIIGRNGAGKSTLLKILSQVTGPSTGSIKLRGRIGSLLEVGTGFHPELTGRENIFLNGAILGMTRKEIESKFDDIVAFSGVAKYVDTPVKRYSSGMLVRLGFAVAAYLEPEILVVDEVLAVGDADFQKKCVGKMQDVAGKGRTILFVSHNMNVINNLCQKVVLLEKGKIKAIGPTREIVDLYLKGGSGDQSLGPVPTEYPRNSFHKNHLSIASITAQDASGKPSEEFRYLEEIRFNIELTVEKEIENAVLVLGFMNDEAGLITYSSNTDPFNKTQIDLKPGKRVLEVLVNQCLIPGIYSLSVALLDPKGFPYEGLQFFGKIRIESFGDGGAEYPWVRPLGYVNLKSTIKLVS